MSGDPRAISRLRELIERVDVVEPDAANEWRTQVQAELRQCLKEAQHSWRSDRGWPRVHSLEERVNARDSRLAFLAKQAADHLTSETNAAARRSAKSEFEKLRRASEADPDDTMKRDCALERARSLIKESHSRSRVKFDSARKTGAGLRWCAAVLMLFGVAAVVGQSLTRELFVPRPEGSDINSTLFLGLLLATGALGGMLSALFSLYLTKKVEDTSWFDPRPTLAWTKVALGAWASVIAAAAVGTGVLVGKYTSVPAALLIGVAFGYSQQLFTGILDKHAAGLTEDTSKQA
jgi:hypothetical protein